MEDTIHRISCHRASDCMSTLSACIYVCNHRGELKSYRRIYLIYLGPLRYDTFFFEMTTVALVIETGPIRFASGLSRPAYTSYDEWPIISRLIYSVNDTTHNIEFPGQDEYTRLYGQMLHARDIYAFNTEFVKGCLAANMIRVHMATSAASNMCAAPGWKCLMRLSRKYMHYKRVHKYPSLSEAWIELQDQNHVRKMMAEPDPLMQRFIQVQCLIRVVQRGS